MRLQEGESVLYEAKPEPAVLWLWLFSKCLPVAVLGAIIAAVFGGLIGAWVEVTDLEASLAPATIALVAGIAMLILLALGLTYCNCLRRTYVYHITNHRCIFHGGILRRVERSVPHHKITDIEMSQNIFERAAGISTLNIFTPGTASSGSSSFGQQAEISFFGLKDNEHPANIVNNMLRKFRTTGE